MDLLVALYFRVMNVRPEEPGWSDRDRFILSKGHSSIGQYVVMALRGYLPVEELKIRQGRLALAGHPDVTKLPGIDTSTGRSARAFGRTGICLGSLAPKQVSTFVVLGDGELQEGMVWGGASHCPRGKRGFDCHPGLEWPPAVRMGACGQRATPRRSARPWSGIDLVASSKNLVGAALRSTD
jgi:transketolase